MYVIEYPESSPTTPTAPSAIHTATSTADTEALQQTAPMSHQPFPGSTKTSTGATYEKHSTVATCVAAVPDSLKVFVGDDSGSISLYELQERGGMMLKGKHSDFEGMVADGGRWGEEEVDAKTLGYKVLSMQVEKT
jgi:hypothetical protein